MNRQISAARFAHRLEQNRIEARPVAAQVAQVVSSKPSRLRILAAVALVAVLLLPFSAEAKGHRSGGHSSHAKRSKKG